jgi:hypothetical protein
MLLDASRANQAVFRGGARKLSSRTKIWSYEFLNRKDVGELGAEEELEGKVQAKWKSFLTQDLPAIVSAVERVFRRAPE